MGREKKKKSLRGWTARTSGGRYIFYLLEARARSHARAKGSQHVTHASLLLMFHHASRRRRGVRGALPTGTAGREIQTRQVLHPPIRPVSSPPHVELEPPLLQFIRGVGRVGTRVPGKQIDQKILLQRVIAAAAASPLLFFWAAAAVARRLLPR